MAGFYAESTLRRKYKETGLSEEQIEAVRTALEACAHFYVILEMKEVWPILGSGLPVTKDEFESLIRIFEKDGSMPFRIDNERAMIADGRDVLLLVDEDYFITLFEDIGRPENDEGVNAEADPDTELDLDDVFGFDFEMFDELYEKREGKALFVPADLLNYADPDYIPQNAYTDAMLTFLRKVLPKRYSAENALVELIWDIREVDSNFSEIAHMLWDMVPEKHLTEQNLRIMMNLLMDLFNHTPMPQNRGAAPVDTRVDDNVLSHTDISSGLSEDLSADMPSGIFFNTKSANIGHGQIPDISRITNPAKVNPTASFGIGNSSGGMNRKEKKVGPNDPCPCGSGKKYKKCCGSK